MGWTRRISLGPALVFATVPLAFLIGIVIFQLAVAVPQADRAGQETIESFQTLRALSAVDEAVQDAERGQRGYLLTGQDSYLAPYLRAQRVLPGLMANLQSAVRGSEQASLLTLQSDVTTKMDELAATIAAARARGLPAALAVMSDDSGRHSMAAVQADLSALNEMDRRRLSEGSQLSAFADHRVTVVFVVGSLLSGLSLIGGAIVIGLAYGRARSSERTLQATLDSVREGVAAFDADDCLRAWNASFARLLGLKPADLQRGARLPESDAAAPSAILSRLAALRDTARKTGRPALAVYDGEKGTTLELFHNGIGDGHVTTILDVSDQRQRDEALRQAQKLESLGQMTGGVAHDFNNLLTIIIGTLGFLRRTVERDPKALQRVNMLEIAAERGARLTKQLLAFARRQPLQPDVVNLSQTMRETLPLLRRAVGETMVVECVVDGGLWNTTADGTQLQSVILNLAINSRHAMPDGGKLTIEVGNASLDDGYAARHAEVEPGQYVVFAITDTGVGMDAATLARAVDPFFTTRPAGEGTGLGLAQAYGFARQSGGHMKLYSEVNEGTTVKLYLPRTLREVPDTRPRTASLAMTGTETVLLVDDDEIVRAVAASMLQDLGYTVVIAASGKQALAMLERGQTADLLFTDVVMPGIGGRQLAQRAAALLPTLRVLFTSGYTENAIVHNGRLDPDVELLSKPYDRDRLAATLRRVLDGPAFRAAGANSTEGTGAAAT
jgi:signal transduction histidine kinase/ActR/RegA family two-component response regulator